MTDWSLRIIKKVELFSDEDIINILDRTCSCHPYYGARCMRCIDIGHIIKHQVKDIQRLMNQGKIESLTRNL